MGASAARVYFVRNQPASGPCTRRTISELNERNKFLVCYAVTISCAD